MPDADVVLAIETSGEVCSVAVSLGERLLAEHTFRHGMHLSETLIGHIDSVLREASTDLGSVQVYAVGVGPGSFTGARIGVMTAKMLAVVNGRPIVSVGSLEALAFHYSGVRGATVLPVLPCRSGVVYAAAYHVDADIPVEQLAPSAMTLDELVEYVGQIGAVILCGPASPGVIERLGNVVSAGLVEHPAASHVARIGARRMASFAAAEDVAALAPLYISPPPITLPRDRRGLPRDAAIPEV